MQAVTVQTYSRREWSQVAPQWAELCDELGASFFMHPDWVSTWLEVFGARLDPQILVFHSGLQCVGACVLVRTTCWLKFLPLRRVYANCAGEPEADGTCIEYNRVLCRPGFEHSVSESLQCQIATKRWDEFVLPGMEPQLEIEPFDRELLHAKTTVQPCWYIDLEALRRKNISYDAAVLSSGKRYHIRRSVRALERQCGRVKLWFASTVEEALDALDELAALHQQVWTRRGKKGAFSSPDFCRFHKDLTRKSFPENHIHLFRVTAGNHSIGLIYAFFLRGHVYAYQAGFNDEDNNVISPGLVTHYFVIQHYLQSRPDVMEYDFLAGDSQYKRSLANAQRTLEWTVVQQPTYRVRCLQMLRNWKARYASTTF